MFPYWKQIVSVQIRVCDLEEVCAREPMIYEGTFLNINLKRINFSFQDLDSFIFLVKI